MSHGIGHDPAKGGVPTCLSTIAKDGAEQYSVNKLFWGVDYENCPKTDDAPARLDQIQNLVLGLAKASGVKYDSDDCETIAKMVCALIDNKMTLPTPDEIVEILCMNTDAINDLSLIHI